MDLGTRENEGIFSCSLPFWLLAGYSFAFVVRQTPFVREYPPALFILRHTAQSHFSWGEAAPLSMLVGKRANAVSIEYPCPGEDLLAAGAL